MVYLSFKICNISLNKSIEEFSSTDIINDIYFVVATKLAISISSTEFVLSSSIHSLHLTESNVISNSGTENNFGNTKENLQYAIDGESYENVTMYPDFAKIAKEEGYSEAARLFTGIGKIEVEHENMFKMLLERLESGAEHLSDDEEEEWICEVCGHVHRGKKPPKVCPVCKHPQEYQSRLNSKK